MSGNIPSFASVKKTVDQLVPMGLPESAIGQKIIKDNGPLSDLDKKTLLTYVNEAVRENESYKEVQQYMTGKLLAPHDYKDGYFLLDPLKHTKRFIKKSILKDILSPKLDIKARIIPCYFDYRPEINSEIFEEEGKTLYNSYEPPFWFKDAFYTASAVPKGLEIPDIYTRLLMHLLNEDVKSFDYVIKWIANSLQGRNRCYLTTIGNQGIGKGFLGQVLKLLHGADNFSEILFSDVQEKKFNSIFVNKRLIYLDELAVKTKKQEDLIKLFANDNMEAEYKGVDSRMVRNYASVYCSSNNIDALRISADDRRFSIVEMTDVPLRQVFSKEDFDATLDPENIRKFAQYLMHVEISEMEMLNPFISTHSQLVRESSVTDLEDYLINEYCKENAGKDILVNDVQIHLSEKFGAKWKPSSAQLMNIQRRMPGYYVLHRPIVATGARPRKMKISELEQQPNVNEQGT